MRKALPPSRTPRLNELRFQYQPIVSLGEDEPNWSEALVRWYLPDGTVRGPAEILPHWLSPNRHETFTRYTLERAASAVASSRDVMVSVNLSPAQIMHPAALKTLESLKPEVRSKLRIELTEQRVHDSAALWDCLELVRERCDVVLLDDVTPNDLDMRVHDGAPIDGVKLDRSVVELLFDGSQSDRVRRFVSQAAERFTIVVAEGVEDPAMCEELFELGVSHAQGFGIGTPDVLPVRSAGIGTPGFRSGVPAGRSQQVQRQQL